MRPRADEKRSKLVLNNHLRTQRADSGLRAGLLSSGCLHGLIKSGRTDIDVSHVTRVPNGAGASSASRLERQHSLARE